MKNKQYVRVVYPTTVGLTGFKRANRGMKANRV